MSGILDYNVFLPLLDFNDFIEILIRVDTWTGFSAVSAECPNYLDCMLYIAGPWGLAVG